MFGHPKLAYWLDTQFSRDLIDCKLSEKGIEQCKEASKYAKEMDFTQIVVSPLRRTMETAYYVFKDHPNFKGMKVVVEPLIREKI